MYYPQYVDASPYTVTVSPGPSIASKSTASGDGLTHAIAGKLSTINVQSRDSVGNILDNTDDNYSLDFVGPDATTTGSFSVTASYISNGLYLSQYVP